MKYYLIGGVLGAIIGLLAAQVVLLKDRITYSPDGKIWVLKNDTTRKYQPTGEFFTKDKPL